MNSSNPFFERSTLDFELPPFALIKDEHYLPAFYEGMAQQLAEVELILQEPEATFENTIVALEKSGGILGRVSLVFFNKSSSDTSDALDAIEEEIAPKLSAHNDAIRLNPALFGRIKKLYEERTLLGLNEDDLWLLERYYRDFHFAGAHLSESERRELTAINERISVLNAAFERQVLADTNDLAIVIDDLTELEGLSETQIATTKAAARSRGLDDKWLITMVNFTGHPWLASLKNRTLREKIMKTSLTKGLRGNSNDNKAVVLELVELRAKRAALFGASSHAEYVLRERNAATPEKVHQMLRQIAEPAVANARKEGAELQKAIEADGHNFELASWDWSYYAEKVRLAKFDIDTAALAPYFELERVLHDGVFYAANKLFGLSFKERPDLVTYHPEARAFEVSGDDGKPIGLFIGDFYTRDSKRGGAWMNNLVDQNFLLGQLPVVCNNLNIPKPPAGQPTLISFDFLTTLFHEFGHALHGLLSRVKYPRVSGTSVERDFVEFPSQVNEMWMLWPEVVDNYAYQYETGEKLAPAIIERINSAAAFNEGHATTSYLQAAILDLAWHQISAGQKIEDVEEFERSAIESYGLTYAPVPTRYRTTYFSHIFAGGYSAGYYGYIWAEVFDADTVEWFKENGGFKRELGEKFRNELLSRGGSLDSMQMYRNFRGRDAVIEPLLKRRGLLG